MRMTNQALTSSILVALLAAGAMVGCDDDAEDAPESDPLEAPEAPGPTASSRTFSLDRSSSNVEFLMEAPLENIHGVADQSMEGDLFVDLTDLTESRGLIRIDIDGLEILQRRRPSDGEELGEETRNERQNEHMRTWFQISDDAPDEVRNANRYAQFNITRVSDASAASVLDMEGAERVITATVHGDFRLHARTTQQSARLELTFAFEVDNPVSMRVRTLEPVPVGLDDHAIRPRSAFGALAEATLTTLGQKVAEAAPITFEFTANAGDAADAAPTTTITESAAAEAATQIGVETEEEGTPAAGTE